MELKAFKYGSHNYKYYLEYSERKSFSLIVFPNLKIILKAPLNASAEDVDSFLIRKWSWLRRQLSELKRYQKTEYKKSYLSGESFYYLGRQYMLKVMQNSQEGIKVSPGVITLSTSRSLVNSKHNQMIYNQWYLEKCESVFKKEILQALKDYDIKTIPKMKVREMKARWGSYRTGTINLNPKLLQAPKAAIRYVITHELCHIEHKNHDEQFYNLLESRIPDWKRIKDELELRFG